MIKSLSAAAAALCLVCWTGACKTEPDDYRPDFGHDYFPLEVGKYRVYEADSTVFDPTGDSMVIFSKTFIKEEIVGTLTDNNGDTLYIMERFERTADSLPWQVSKVFTAAILDNKAIQTEDNLRFIKIVFPARRNATWNGHVHFDPSLIVTVAGESLEMFKGWAYRITATGERETIGSFDFDDVLTVRESDNENFIELRRSHAKYARGIGLVYRELWILDTQCIEPCAGLPWEEKAEKGFILTQKIIDYN